MNKRSRSCFIFRSNSVISNPVLKSFLLIACGWLVSCGTQRQISKAANAALFQDSAVQHAHVGISLFNATDNKYLFDLNAKKYFVPASNTKLFSCYAALKYLGDSLAGINDAQTGKRTGGIRWDDREPLGRRRNRERKLIGRAQ